MYSLRHIASTDKGVELHWPVLTLIVPLVRRMVISA
jgi:hypothetical protein